MPKKGHSNPLRITLSSNIQKISANVNSSARIPPKKTDSSEKPVTVLEKQIFQYLSLDDTLP
jgi:hypothetical protein